MSDALIVSLLAFVAVAGAALSFLAWHRVSKRPRDEKSQFDSDNPNV